MPDIIVFSLIVAVVMALLGFLEDGKRGVVAGFLIGFAGFGPLFYYLMFLT